MKLLLEKTTLDAITTYLAKCADTGERYKVTVEKYRHNRSLEQNAMLHALFRRIADFTGNSAAEIKDYCCAEFLGEVAYEFNGEVKARAISTSELKTDEFSDLIERVEALAIELGA